LKKPNILLITADQLRMDAVGAYGNEKIKTKIIIICKNPRRTKEYLQFILK